MEDKREGIKTILRGDFNAGKEGGEAVEGEEREKEGRKRRSKDEKVDRESKILLEFVEKRVGNFQWGGTGE